jgi:hypothetical protein
VISAPTQFDRVCGVRSKLLVGERHGARDLRVSSMNRSVFVRMLR